MGDTVEDNRRDQLVEKKLFAFRGRIYPEYLKSGNACRFIVPYAQEFCKGIGLDIGGNYEWLFPGARPINFSMEDGYDAYRLPDQKYDYIFSSHTLEHLPNYVKALSYWRDHLVPGGVLFLYLPHPEMSYWRPQNNSKHLHIFYPVMMEELLLDLGFKTVLYGERDLYWSFAVVGIMKEEEDQCTE